MFEQIETVTPFLKPFPDFNDVFGEPIALHRKHFLPLISVDVSVIHPDLDIWLHFVTPIEPLLELDVGYFTDDYHDFYNSCGQFALKFTNGKYTFTGDFNYFAYESEAIYKAFPEQRQEIDEDYAIRFSSWERCRIGYEKHGRVPWYADEPFDPANDSGGFLITQLGGDAPVGNWGTEPPLNQSDRPFRFIGEVQGYSYCEGGIQAILMFYDPDEQIVLFRTDYT